MIAAPDIERIAYFNGLRAMIVQEATQLRMGGDLYRLRALLDEIEDIPRRSEDEPDTA